MKCSLRSMEPKQAKLSEKRKRKKKLRNAFSQSRFRVTGDVMRKNIKSNFYVNKKLFLSISYFFLECFFANLLNESSLNDVAPLKSSARLRDFERTANERSARR